MCVLSYSFPSEGLKGLLPLSTKPPLVSELSLTMIKLGMMPLTSIRSSSRISGFSKQPICDNQPHLSLFIFKGTLIRSPIEKHQKRRKVNKKWYLDEEEWAKETIWVTKGDIANTQVGIEVIGSKNRSGVMEK